MGKRIFLAAIAFMVSALSIGTNIKTADAENGKTYPVRVAEQMDNVTGQCVLYGAAEDAVPRDEIWVMYNALSDDDKAVYNLFFDLAVQQKGEDYVSLVLVPEYKLKSLGEKHLWHIYSAMRHDHPELFFLSDILETINCMKLDLDGYYLFFFSMKDNDFSEEIRAFDDATNAFMEDIDLSASDLEIELQIHDKLMELVCYDDPSDVYLDEYCSDPKYTAYGALVENSVGMENHALCRGYALAFEHLMHMAGIPCGYVSGEVYSPDSEYDEERLPHGWNVVKIDDKWYEVDVTWDDMDGNANATDEFADILKSDAQKYYNWKHHYFNRSTFEMRNLRATEDTLYEIEGYLPYNPVKNTSHRRIIRASENFGETEAFLNSLLPYAR